MGNRMRRSLCVLLAFVMVISNSVVAFAGENSGKVGTRPNDTESSVVSAAEGSVAQNTKTMISYSKLTEALMSADEGETIVLSEDTKESIVSVPENVTLNLNGYTLEATYVTCFGNLVDLSEENTGLLKVSAKRFLIQQNNKQLPMKNGEGYQFFDVTKFNATYREEYCQYAFQPFVERSAHEILSCGAAETGVTINVRCAWSLLDGQRSQDFVYTDDFVQQYIDSFYLNGTTEKYRKMFTIALKGAEGFGDIAFRVVLVSDTGVQIQSSDTVAKDKSSADVTVDANGQLAEEVTLSNAGATAVIAPGTKLKEGVTRLTLTTKKKSNTDSDVTLEESEELLSLDVHIEGIAADNTVPVIVTLKKVAPEYLNQGNISLHHVENGETVTMTRVYSLEDMDVHNEFYYEKLTGTISIAMATFSEVVIVSDTENAWEGKFDYAWYDVDATELTICNADQLAAFGAIVSGMDAQTKDNFEGKTIKLLADINLGDAEAENDADKIFYPIGYYNSTGSYERNGDAISSSVSAFRGTFDGNGHTISNFYQNTWEMFGDYNSGYPAGSNYYQDAMGLFGYVVDGTVKNLTVDNFSSDGEFTPTGVIAAYAVNSTFENIAVTNCNPRVYNTGNGGIVGIGGNSDDPDTYKLTFNNITIDNTNKITALWGSWDVACGGLVGMFRGAGHAYMTNCHVAAQMDVYNDVCGNYQYYWYRYAGMMIGTNKNMVTDAEGYTVPETTKFHAENCTVHFGEWNDYYYCELVANSLASYTHDHQFSRLEQIESLDEIKSNDTWIKTGNFLLISGDTKTCYHIVNKDGVLTQHNHVDAGEETVNGETVLKENNQIVYLPFNQLFTGYGWGVKHIPVYNGEDYAFEGITILDREVANSVVKFDKADTAKDSYTTAAKVTIGELFKATEAGSAEKTAIDNANVQVTVSPVGETSTAGGVYTANTTDWTQGTLTFSGIGAAKITITDYYFCTPTTITVTITDKVAVEKFETKFTGDFLYRVGNQNEVSLGSLFKAKDDAEIGTVSVTVETIKGASGTYTPNATWTNGKIQFTDTGIVKVTLQDDDTYCAPTELILEVVDAVNATVATSATANNVVLLNDIGSGFTVSGRYTVYGNGFTLNYTGNGQYLNNGLKQGIVTVSENGTLDNLRIVASIYPSAYLYYGSTLLGEYVQGGSSDGNNRYYYQLSAVAASGNATISNCYVYGGRNNIFVNTGDVTITDSVLECGIVANVQIQSNSSHTITLEDVTTIQYRVNATIGDTSKVMLGAGVLVGPETNDNPTIVLNGDFKQYNWVSAEDANAVSDTKVTKAIINGALNATAYNHTVNGKTSSNLGIIYMNTYDATTNSNKTGLPYELADIEMEMLGNSAKGQVYSLQDATAEQIYSDYTNADRSTANGLYEPQFKYSADLGGQYIENTDDGDEHCYREGDTIHVMFPSGDTKELNLAALVNIVKYMGQDLNLEITCQDENGNLVTVTGGKITLSEAGKYTVTYKVTDELFFDKDGNKVSKSIEYSWDITISVSLKDTAVPDAYFAFESTKQKMGYYKPSFGDVKQYLPFLAGLKIYDYNGKASYLRFDGDVDFNKIASVTITGYTSNEAYIEVKLTDGGVINTKFLARADSGGGSTYTGKIKTKNNIVYFVNDGGTSNSASTTTSAYWYVDYYKFTGNNGVAIQSAQQTFNSTGSSASTPSGNFSTTIKYTVTYDANEGNCGQTTGYATSASAAVTLPTPTRSGYLFAGWYTAASGGTRVGGAGESYTPSANITLYAQWGKPCTVTYDANGGSCGTASEKYTGTALTLPTPTRDGYWFIGWYDAATGENKIGDAGATYNPKGDITLYAHWQEAVEYTVTYDANDGTCSTASATYEGTALTLPTPTRTGYEFLGWYTAASGDTKIGNAGAAFIPSADITLYAQWEKIAYTITVSESNATVSSVVSGDTAYYGDIITFTVTYSGDRDQTTTVKDANGTTVTTTVTTPGSYTFTMPASNVTISASSSCVTPDTLITLADGSQVRVDSLIGDEELLVWNMETGAFDTAPIMFVDSDPEEEFEIIHLYFSDGTDVKVIYEHGFWDYNLNKYVYLDRTAEQYIGHEFAKQIGDSLTRVTLTDVVIEKMVTTAWSPVTEGHLCYFVNGMLSMPGGVGGLFNIFDVDEQTMTYDQEAMARDIEIYGLFTYEELNAIVPLSEEMFNVAGGAYLKVSIGKGNMTMDDLIYMIQRYSKYFE